MEGKVSEHPCEKMGDELSDLKTEVALTRSSIIHTQESVDRHKMSFDKQVEEILDVLKEFTSITFVVKRHDKWINRKDDWKNDIWNMIYKTAVVILLGWVAWKLGLTKP